MALRRTSVDRLFARFCRKGDPAALGKVFDRTAPELAKVAAWVAGDAHRAEDLLQRTFLVAIESRASWDPDRPVLPWLIGILTNQARNLRRAERPRPQPTPTALHLEPPDPADQAAAHELEAAVAEARAALHDPYRQVLELHLDHGLGSAEIATVLRRPPGTVRTQIARGLEMVRQRLPRGFVAGTAALLTAAQLRALREAVLAQAGTATAMTGAAAGAALLTGGWLVMQKKAFVAAVAAVGLVALAVPVALGAFGKGKVSDTATAPDVLAPIEEPVAEGAEPEAPPVEAPSPTRRVAAAVPDEPGADPTTATLEVRLHWKEGGGPAARIGLQVVSWDQPDRRLDRRGISDADGRCVLERVHPGKCVVYLGLGGSRTVQLEAGAREVVEIAVVRVGTARGVVVDPQGQPIEGARVWLLSSTGSWKSGYEVTRSGADGRFEIALGSNHYVGARKAGYVPSLLRSVQPGEGEVLQFELRLRSGAGAVRGVVLDPRGEPVAEAKVLVGMDFVYGVSQPGAAEMLSEALGTVVRTDGEGKFSVRGVRAGRVPVEVDAVGFAPWREEQQVELGHDLWIEVRLQAPAVVEGRVTDSDGKAVASAQVAVRGGLATFAERMTQSDEDGRYRLEDLPSGSVALGASEDAIGRANATLRLSPGTTTEWNPVLGKGRTITGIVLGPDGKPRAGLRVGTRDPQISVQFDGMTKTGSDGRFLLANLERPRYTLSVLDGETLLREEFDVRPGTDLVLRLSEDDLPTAALTGRLVDHEGRAVAKAQVSLWRPGAMGAPGYSADGESGVFEVGPLVPGTYSLTAMAPGRGVLSLGTFRLARGEERDLGEVRFEPTGTVAVRLVDADGTPARSGFYVLAQSEEGLHIGGGNGQEGKALLERLPPGEWLVSTHVDFAHRAAARVTVRSGETTEVELRPVPARTVVLTLESGRSGESLGRANLLVRDSTGRLVYAGVAVAQEREAAGRIPLLPGDYRVEVLAAGDLYGTESLRVPEGAGGEMRIRIPLHPR